MVSKASLLSDKGSLLKACGLLTLKLLDMEVLLENGICNKYSSDDLRERTEQRICCYITLLQLLLWMVDEFQKSRQLYGNFSLFCSKLYFSSIKHLA